MGKNRNSGVIVVKQSYCENDPIAVLHYLHKLENSKLISTLKHN